MDPPENLGIVSGHRKSYYWQLHLHILTHQELDCNDNSIEWSLAVQTRKHQIVFSVLFPASLPAHQSCAVAKEAADRVCASRMTL